MTNLSGAFIIEVFKLEEDVIMVPVIDKRKTGEQIRKYMNLRGLTVQDVKTYLSLGCVQSVYHWLDGQSAPNLDNLYALSELLRVPMDLLVAGNRSYKPEANLPTGAIRLLRYYRLLYECMAA
jgi:transcriptional regulator with XRE-family HTH domain